MDFSLNEINLDQVETDRAPSILGAGQYTATVTSAQYGQNSKGTGWNLTLEFKDSGSTGTIRSWTTVKHTNPDAQRIGLEQLKNMLVNMGWENANPPEADWFRGKAVGINVVDEKDHEGNTRSRVNYTFKVEATIDDELPF